MPIRRCHRRQLVAERVGLRDGVDARAIGGVHRMQRLDREGHAIDRACSSNSPMPSRTISPRALQITRNDATAPVLRQAADDEDEATCAERQRLVDRTPIVVPGGAASLAVRRRQTSRRAQSGHRQTGVANSLRRVGETGRRDLIAPRCDASNAVTMANRR
jgi:hypothetical protein